MKYFVYRTDDYGDCGGVGLETFDMELQACAHIEERMALTGAGIADYKVIRGEEIAIIPIQAVTKIKFK